MATKHSLGRPLLAVGCGSLALIATLIVLVATESFRQIELSTRAQTRGEAFRRLEAIRDQIVEAATTQPAASLEQVFDAHPRLNVLLARDAASDEIYEHITVLAVSGRVVAREGPRIAGPSVRPEAVELARSPGAAPMGQYGEVASLAGGERAVEYSVPIDFQERRLGTVCLSVSQDLLELRIAGAHYPLRRVLVPLVLACVAVLAIGGAATWWLIHRARQLDREAARQEHLAEVGKLAGGLAHEIRNPLNAMRMQIAVIRKKLSKRDDPDIRVAATQLERLEQEVLRMQDLATEFLAFGRPASGNPDVIDLRALVADVAEFIRAEFQQAHSRVTVKADDNSGEILVRMDRDKLRQVMLNLAENARQAMPGGGDLTIRLGARSNREVWIEVSDTGCGIPADRLPRIFEAFYSTKDEGSGLGLAIVKQIIEAAGGQIRVRSDVDRGTCFEIRLPRAGLRPSREMVEVLE